MMASGSPSTGPTKPRHPAPPALPSRQKDGTAFKGVPFSLEVGTLSAFVARFLAYGEAAPRVLHWDEIARWTREGDHGEDPGSWGAVSQTLRQTLNAVQAEERTPARHSSRQAVPVAMMEA